MEFIEELLQMKSLGTDEVTRYSGFHSAKPETLSHHLVEMMMVSLKLYYRIQKEDNVTLDLGVLMTKCLVHDLDEVITGDFPRPIKYMTKDIKEAIEVVSDITVKKLSELEFDNSQIYDKWKNAKLGKEGLVIKVVDMILVARKAILEVVNYSNKTYLKVLVEVLDYLRGYVKVVEDTDMITLKTIVMSTIQYLENSLDLEKLDLNFDINLKISSYKEYYTEEGD